MLTEAAPDATETPGHLAYQPALDGLRAVAVSVVVLYHLGYSWMRGGFLGVDAFFVLSGFLITSLLLRERQRTGGTGFRGFWSRRARRLLPAAFLMIALVTAYGSTVVNAYSLDTLRWDAVSGVLYYANWHFIASGQSYFSLFVSPSPLTHLWSLAIEEQFYLVWPLVFAFVMGRARLRTLLAVCIAGIVGSQIVMMVLWDAGDPSRAYYATPARLNTILTGCALAVLLAMKPDLLRTVSRRVLAVVAVVALLVCAAAWIRMSPSRAFFFGADTLFGLAFATVLLVFQGARTPVRGVFELRPIVWLGTISYAVYLWHWPVIVYLDGDRTGLSGNALNALRIAVTLAISVVSVRLLERPVRHSRVPVLRWAVPATIVTLAIVFVTTAGAAAPPNFAVRNSGQPCPTPSASELAQAKQVVTEKGVPSVPALKGKRITVIGDSRACSLVVGMDAAAPLVGAVPGNGSVLGCGVVAERFDVSGLIPASWRDRCPGAFRKAFARVRDRSDVLVWWSAWEGEDLFVGDRLVKPESPEHDRILRARMERWLAEEVPAGTHVAIVLTPQPNETTNVDAVRHPRQLDRVYADFAAAHPDRVSVLDLDTFLCPDGAPCNPEIDGQPVRPDGTHLSPAGAGLVARWMLPQLDAMVAK